MATVGGSLLSAAVDSSEDCAWELLLRLAWQTSILHLRAFARCAVRLADTPDAHPLWPHRLPGYPLRTHPISDLPVGWGIRMMQSVLAACVPIVIQVGVRPRVRGHVGGEAQLL